ncbi:hypothetical protein SAMN06272759_101563 [Novosphingobium sp. B1]|nr:hypothetical protein SAMN06272759_101563 [Novosphingobium sp. B1]
MGGPFAVRLYALPVRGVILTLDARLQAVDCHGKMKRCHCFAVVIKIIQHARQGGVEFIKWSGCLHGKFFSRSARRWTSYPAAGTDPSYAQHGS